MTKLIKSHIATVLFLLLILSLWEAGVRLFHVPFYILPAPSRILFVFFTRLPLLFSHGVVTLLEIGLGMFLGVSGGITLALIIFYSPFLESALYPLIITSQMIPVFAIAPLLVIWFGYGLWSKATVAALIVFFPIVVNTVDGLRSVNRSTAGKPSIHILRTEAWSNVKCSWSNHWGMDRSNKGIGVPDDSVKRHVKNRSCLCFNSHAFSCWFVVVRDSSYH